ncbi:DUF2339 domain-containing protein [Aquimarina sp. 2201CG14-23]|uniref:DUF2339 domain-containing protein n=1 Tax=Aquimarina mycalae TaxID=3040073 RepID=UPI002477E85D|nr:DUF2339 domain-containing protein [Aquimarina sp. 2201CG14-23]MDH7444363.1 DUF2339 domain-containing protein [Aquimarina sp. 2201CG14-23]
MANNQDYINELLKKIEILSKKQEVFHREILDLKGEIYKLKGEVERKEEPIVEDRDRITSGIAEPTLKNIEDEPKPVDFAEQKQPITPITTPTIKEIVKPKGKSNWEKFIGENLISKIGVVILIIGVAIGTKYSIDNDLISPLTRIVLGYITGIGLITIGMKLKQKYENFSAVLVSGAMAILYFITFMAYSLYDLIPQLFAFGLMVLFTIFTVFAAIQYNRQVIAHIGLVGAYAVPFLLSDGSGRVGVLFSYMAIINIGILVISLQRYWKSLYYSSFFLTWLIYFSWYVSDYETGIHFGLAAVFLLVFFTTFYVIFLMYKLIRKEKFSIGDIILQLINAFVFYGIGFSMLDNHPEGNQLLGVFTLGNAIIHFIISVFIYRLKLADRNLFYFISGMVLVFISIAFPVQLDGNWVTLLWAAEAVLLFWIGRTKKVPIYEKLAYPVIALAFFSVLQDWWFYYVEYSYVSEVPESNMIPFFNISVLTSLICVASLGYILYLHRSDKYPFQWPKYKTWFDLISLWISAMFLFVLYMTFFLEINEYWNNQNENKQEFRGIWLINYTLIFLIIISLVNIRKFKNMVFGYINVFLNLFGVLIFLSSGLYILSELREIYLNSKLLESSEIGLYHIGIRYISLIFGIGLLAICYQYVRQDFLKRTFKISFDVILQIAIIWIISSELIHWLDIAGYISSDKLGLSILWGLYALLLIALGFWKKTKHIRVIAFILFGITLIKLFLYDIAHLNTISKTIVFVSLGVLLLIISFLYNKYKHIIADEIKD